MKLLVISARYPEAGGKGDQARTFSFVSHLGRRHDVTVVTPGTRPSHAAAELPADVVSVPVTTGLRGAGAALAVAWGQPGQAGWMFPVRVWRVALQRATSADVALAVTLRSVRGMLPCPLVIDHVDSLALNMRRRAQGPERAPVRLAAHVEALLLERFARTAARWCAAQVVTTREDAADLPQEPPPHVIPVAFDGTPFVDPPGHARDIDLIFSGSMRYPPNRAAAMVLDSEIVPAVRRRMPGIRAVVVGRSADSLPLVNCERLSDVPDLLAVMRRARVLVAPLEGGTGSPYKLLEAAASGVAVVAPEWAARAFELPSATAEAPEQFAERALHLLAEDGAREALVARARSALERHRGDVLAAQLEQVLLSACAR